MRCSPLFVCDPPPARLRGRSGRRLSPRAMSVLGGGACQGGTPACSCWASRSGGLRFFCRPLPRVSRPRCHAMARASTPELATRRYRKNGRARWRTERTTSRCVRAPPQKLCGATREEQPPPSGVGRGTARPPFLWRLRRCILPAPFSSAPACSLFCWRLLIFCRGRNAVYYQRQTAAQVELVAACRQATFNCFFCARQGASWRPLDSPKERIILAGVRFVSRS